MLSDLLDILKFMTDPQTRNTINAIAEVASQKQSDWKKGVYKLKGEFTSSDWAEINVFTNELFKMVSSTGISESKLERFKTVYTELVDNAHNHGCRGQVGCKVKISCTYSRWFIQLEVIDNGKGFNLQRILDSVEYERSDNKRKGKSGLELVIELADSVNVRRSHVVAVIAGEDRIKIHILTKKISRKSLLIVTVEDRDEWSFLFPSWEPLRDVLEKSTQPLVLVRFGKPPIMMDEGEAIPSRIPEYTGSMRSTKPRRAAKPVILDCALDNHRYFAYVTPERWVYDDLSELEKNNLRFFRNEDDAYLWLKDCSMGKHQSIPSKVGNKKRRLSGLKGQTRKRITRKKTDAAENDF